MMTPSQFELKQIIDDLNIYLNLKRQIDAINNWILAIGVGVFIAVIANIESLSIQGKLPFNGFLMVCLILLALSTSYLGYTRFLALVKAAMIERLIGELMSAREAAIIDNSGNPLPYVTDLKAKVNSITSEDVISDKFKFFVASILTLTFILMLYSAIVIGICR